MSDESINVKSLTPKIEQTHFLRLCQSCHGTDEQKADLN